ncbi:hypothetical protein RB195_017245 [Necator americanus]|uniref:Uncharacterized protein n=1 Tax=Necator americanus TaxID=51031 RepID=A0ABR1C4C5_NECAM
MLPKSLILIGFVLVSLSDAQQFYNPWEGLKLLPQFPTQAPSYMNYYKGYGYETDDKGNVWAGNDAAKIMIIAKSSYP